MFVYQTKIEDKDALVFVSETQDQGKQAPPVGVQVLVIWQDGEGIMYDDTGVFYPDGSFLPAGEQPYLNLNYDSLEVDYEARLIPDFYPETMKLKVTSSDDTVATAEIIGEYDFPEILITKIGNKGQTCVVTVSGEFAGQTYIATCNVTLTESL